MIDVLDSGRALLLIVVANVVPWAAARAMRRRWSAPLDCGVRFWDGERLRSDHKTWRGFLLGTLGAPNRDTWPARLAARRTFRSRER